jgi:hypothetical protein
VLAIDLSAVNTFSASVIAGTAATPLSVKAAAIEVPAILITSGRVADGELAVAADAKETDREVIIAVDTIVTTATAR